jgi:putative hemolysin
MVISVAGQQPAAEPAGAIPGFLEMSARLCGPPAMDREFKTIDFPTLLDLQRLPDRVRTRFF